MSPRIKSNSARTAKSTEKPTPSRSKSWLFSVFILAVLAIGAHFAWLHSKPQLAHDPHFALTVDNIHVSPQPPWIRSDIKTQALQNANLIGSLSQLDDWEDLSNRIKRAFEIHPWVASVTRITRQRPGSLDVELMYRKPVAAVESRDSTGVVFLPIDTAAIRLPEGDLTDAEARYLPRISGITGRPLVGDQWNDPRVIGGAKLAAQLADVWQKLRLVEILPSVQPAAGDERQIYRYEIVTTGGTRIVWGMTPGDETAFGESTFAQKRQRLIDYAEKQGKLESIDGPAMLDVRSSLVVTPRTARQKSEVKSADSIQTK